MMKIKAQTIKELDTLAPVELLKMYDFMIALKITRQQPKTPVPAADYLKVREALKTCRGALADDILTEREDRI